MGKGVCMGVVAGVWGETQVGPSELGIELQSREKKTHLEKE
jgi:hypothetical protein